MNASSYRYAGGTDKENSLEHKQKAHTHAEASEINNGIIQFLTC